jgi:hypothetical protein
MAAQVCMRVSNYAIGHQPTSLTPPAVCDCRFRAMFPYCCVAVPMAWVDTSRASPGYSWMMFGVLEDTLSVNMRVT